LAAFAERVAATAGKCVKSWNPPAQGWRARELLGLVRALATWECPAAHRLLWSLATNQNPEIEWWGAEALAMSEGDPVSTLRSNIREVLEAAENESNRERINHPADDAGQKIASLAWILPALRDPRGSVEPEF